MDLLDFSDCKLYFEEPLPAAAESLLSQAANQYGEDGAELALLRAHLLAPENLTVLVGLYRYYFYQHRLEDALQVAERAMQLSGRHLGLLRFYLLALKAASVVMLRLGDIDASRARLSKLAGLDIRDQLGAAKLLEVLDEFQRDESEAQPELILAAA